MLIYLLFIRVAQVDDGQNELHFLPFRFAQSEQSQRASPPKEKLRIVWSCRSQIGPVNTAVRAQSSHCRPFSQWRVGKFLLLQFPVVQLSISFLCEPCRAFLSLGAPLGVFFRLVLYFFSLILRPQIIPRSSSLRSTVKPPFMLAALLAIVHCWNGARC